MQSNFVLAGTLTGSQSNAHGFSPAVCDVKQLAGFQAEMHETTGKNWSAFAGKLSGCFQMIKC